MVKRGLVGLLVLWSFWLAGTGPPVSAQTGAGPAMPPSSLGGPGKGSPAKEFSSPPQAQPVTIQLDKTQLNNGGTLKVSGTAPAGKPVYLEIYAEKTVRSNFFDKQRDKETGRIPYILYLTEAMPGFYKIIVPRDLQGKIEKIKKEGKKWSFSKALKDLGADIAYSAPGRIKIDPYQASILASIIGSRGDLLPSLDEKENKKRSLQLAKSRFRSVDKLLAAAVEVNPDGTYQAEVKIRSGLPDGAYRVVAVAGKDLKSNPAVFENKIGFPLLYLSNAGTSINLFWPFLLTLAISIFGVLMGAGGGFILTPLLLLIWPLPHNVVAGTVMPTVLFSQASGIYNYSKIKFINWKVGVIIGLSMLVGGFIGPKLTELITLDQFKFVFGWILLILAALLIWQTMPGYVSRNKKDQAILKEFKKRAEEAAQGKKA